MRNINRDIWNEFKYWTGVTCAVVLIGICLAVIF